MARCTPPQILSGLVALAACALPQMAHADQCARYDDSLAVTGQLTRQVFAGPPNYESVSNGDAPEAAYILQTQTDYCFAQGDGEFEKAQDHVQSFQVPYQDELKQHQNQTVTITGPVFPAQTGHHFAPVVFEPEQWRLTVPPQ